MDTCHAMGGHRSLLMIIVWVWVQIRRKMLGLVRGLLGFPSSREKIEYEEFDIKVCIIIYPAFESTGNVHRSHSLDGDDALDN
jgi:hypothetical protein